MSSRHTGKGPKGISPIGPTILYDVHALGAAHFEELCCSLFHAEPGLIDPDLNNTQRQKQYGVDVIAEKRSGVGIDVMSCKCYKTLEKGDIPAFAQEFLDHWDSYWKVRKVKRFVLALACTTHSAQRQQEIAIVRQKCKALGVKSEVWNRRTLSNRIRRNSGVLRDYFGEWSGLAQSTIRPSSSAGAASFLSAAEVQQIGALQSALGRQIAQKLDDLNELMCCGESEKARSALDAIRLDGVTWPSLDPVTQSRVVRMQALHALAREDLGTAEQLLNEADSIAPAEEPRARALLALRREGVPAALRTLTTITTKRGALLSSGLLIEAGKLPEARALLLKWKELEGNDPEWHRLSAFLALLSGIHQEAIYHVEVAEKLAPNWSSVLHTGGVIRYGTALSNAADFHPAAWPSPVHADLVKQDDASQKVLAKALEIFELLGKKADEQDKLRAELWMVACLGGLRKRSESAKELLLRHLIRKPIHPIAVFWALRLECDLPLQVIPTLRKQLRERGTPDDLQALLACHCQGGAWLKAKSALAQYRGKFSSDRDAALVFESWERRISRGLGKRVGEAPTINPYEHLELLFSDAKKSGEWSSFEIFLGTESIPAAVLFEGCKFLAAFGRWTQIQPHIPRILNEVGGAEGVRLAAHALYKAREFNRVDDLLTQNVSVFPTSQLPHELGRLHISAATLGGNAPRALEVATSLAAQTSLLPDQLGLAELRVQMGDIAEAVPLLRQVLKSNALTSPQLLHFVPPISTEDPTLAKEMLARAIQLGVSPEHGGMAINWLFKLGLESEANLLLQRLAVPKAQDKDAPVWSATLDDVKAFIIEKAKHRQQLNEAYDHGRAPIQMICAASNMNIARIWDRAFREGDLRSSLFIRHGNRAQDFFGGQVPDKVTLCLDITALLTADRLALLDFLDAASVRIALPRSLPQALMMQEESARHQQPVKLEHKRQIVRAVESGLLKVHGDIRNAGMVLVGVIFGGAHLGEAPSGPYVSLNTLGKELVARGAVSRERFDDILGMYSTWGESASGEKLLADGASVVFHANTVDSVIEADLLKATADQFSLYIEKDYHDHCKAEVHDAELGNAVAERLRSLRQKLADGIKKGRYQLLPEVAMQEGVDSQMKDDVLMRPLRELFGTASDGATWIWIDDRFCTSFTRAQANPIVSSYEVLRYLKDRHAIEPSKFFEILTAMRAAGMQILPVTADEVAFWLAKSEVVDGAMVETPELRIIRRSLNHLLAIEDKLDLDTTLNKPTETICLIDAFRVARATLEAIWTDSRISNEQRHACSDWIWHQLRVERFKRLPLHTDNEATHQRLWQLSLSHFLMIGFSLAREDEKSGRRAYFNWLTRRVPALRGDGDKQSQDDIAKLIGDLLLSDLLNEQVAPNGEAVSYRTIKALCLRFIEDLPEVIRDRLRTDPRLADAVQLRIESVVTVGEMKFDAQLFWVGMQEAIAGGTATVSTNTGASITVRCTSSNPLVFMLEGEEEAHLGDASFVLLQDSAERTNLFLSNIKVQIDGPDVDVEAEIRRIAALPTGAERMHALNERREKTFGGMLRNLNQALLQQQLSTNVLVPDSARSFLHYLGIDPAIDTPNWDQIGTTLVQKWGAREAVKRLSGLPISVPPSVLKAFSKLDKENLQNALTNPNLLTPLHRLKLIKSILPLVSSNDLLATLIGAQLNDLVTKWEELSNAHTAILRWSERLWRGLPEWAALPVGVRIVCVWAYADVIFSQMLSNSVPLKWLADTFEELGYWSLGDALRFDNAYEADVANPTRISAITWLVQGLSAALGASGALYYEPLRQQLTEILTQPIENGRFPSIFLFQDRRVGSDRIQSFLREPVQEWLRKDIRVGDTEVLADEARDQILTSAMDAVSKEPESTIGWTQILGAGYQWLAESKRSEIQEILLKFELPSDLSSDDQVRLVMLVDRIVPFCNDAVKDAFTQGLVIWARHLSKAHKRVSASLRNADSNVEAFCETLFALSRSSTNASSFDHLAYLVTRVLAEWPATATMWRPIIERVFMESPSKDAHVLWQLYVRLRAET